MRLALKLAAVCLVTNGLVAGTPKPCLTETLDKYIALGAVGCTNGGTVFANFKYAGTASGDAPIIKAGQITVVPSFQPPTTGAFTFMAPWNAATEQTQDSKIAYTAVMPCRITQPAALDLKLGDARVLGTPASATVQESTNVSDLNVFGRCFDFSCDAKKTDSREFNPVSVVLVTDNVSIVGGLGGASVDKFTASFSWCALCP